jgi:hypothetical protein
MKGDLGGLKLVVAVVIAVVLIVIIIGAVTGLLPLKETFAWFARGGIKA